MNPNISLQNYTNNTFDVGLSVAYLRYFSFKNMFFFSKYALVENNGPYFLALVILFIMAFVVEVLNFFRFNIQAKALKEYNPLIKYQEDRMTIPWKKKIILSVIYFFSAILSYLLLLMVFSLDFGVYLVIVLGYTTGFAIFGFKRRKSYFFLYNPKADKCQFHIES